VSSANFTHASRRSAEFGYWTEDAELVGGVARFLVRLIGAYEDLDSAADAPDPELAHVEFDDEAMPRQRRSRTEPAARRQSCARGVRRRGLVADLPESR